MKFILQLIDHFADSAATNLTQVFSVMKYTAAVVILVIVVASVSSDLTCPLCLTIEAGDQTRESSTACSCNVVQTVSDLQSALVMIAGLTATAPEEQRSCVQVCIPSGSHAITAPVDLRDASVEFVSVSVESDPPTIHCSYPVDVDLERIFDPDYDYVNYTMSFSGSDYVSFDSVEFVGCPYPLRLERVRNVAVRNSTFQKFSEAVLDIFNCPNITITDSSFFNNSGTGISRVPFRANSGAVAIGYNNIDVRNITDSSFIVMRCNFTNNRATALAAFRTTNNAFFNRVFTGRGGGLGIFINESTYNITGIISDSDFTKNYARSFGGGLYIVIFGANTQNKLLVERNDFTNNVGLSGAGGFLLTFFSVGLESDPHQTNVTDCSFTGNSGETGGAILAYLAYEVTGFSFFKLERCNFSCNRGIGSMDDFGSALTAWLVNHLRDKQSIPQNEIIDCIFEGNTGTNGIVSVGYVPMIFLGRNIFRRNSGTSSLRIIGTLVDLLGYMEFSENVDDVATSLELLSFGQIRIHSDFKMNFTRNVGRFGSSISSSTVTLSRTFRNLIFNPQCFLVYEDTAEPPTAWSNVSVSFHANEAVLASSVYVSTLETCSWFSSSFPFFNSSYVLKWPIWDFQNTSKNSGYSDPYSVQYQVETAPRVLETPKKNVSAWPGRKFKVQLRAWDEYLTQTSAGARFSFRQASSEEQSVTVGLEPQVVVIDSDGDNLTLVQDFLLDYTPSSVDALSVAGPLGYIDVNALYETSRATGDSFVLYPELCPGGFQLVTSPTIHCQCKDSDPGVLNCEADQDSIVVQNGMWVSTVPLKDANRHVMNFHVCPAGYCRCVQNSSLGMDNCVYMFVNSDPDAQCECNRQGILCGYCDEGLGVSALFSNCVSCSNAHGLIILLLIAIAAAVMVAIILLDIQMPPILYAFIFYFKTIPFAALYFPETFHTAGQYLYFLSSFLSFYLPYDFCLSRNLSSEVAYFLRLIPLFIALLVAVPLTIVLRHMKWKRKWKFRGVWVIFLFLYSHTVYTSLSILNCLDITVHKSSESTSQLRWFVSGGTVCFTGGHAPLAVLAIVLLLLCLLLIPLVACIATGKIPKRFHWIQIFQQPLIEGFNDHLKWWAAVELGRRLLSIVLIVFFPRTQAYLLLFLCVVLVLYGYLQPYKERLANVVEIIVELNFILLLLLVSSQVLELYYSIPSLAPLAGASHNSSECVGGSSLATAPVTWILTPFYYLPLVILVGAVIGHFIQVSIIRKKNSFKKQNSLKKRDGSSFRYFSSAATTQEFSLSQLKAEDDEQSSESLEKQSWASSWQGRFNLRKKPSRSHKSLRHTNFNHSVHQTTLTESLL